MLLVNKKEHHIYLYSLIAAILLHIILLIIPYLLNFIRLLLLALFPTAQLFSSPEAPKAETQPIVLEFRKPEQAFPEKFWELYENPNANELTPEESDILSTESSISAAPSPEAEPSPVPRADESGMASENEMEQAPQEVKDYLGQQDAFAYNTRRKFSKEALTGAEQPAENVSEEKQPATAEVVSEDFDAKLVGDFALSTYEWNWAPYWLEFKRKLYRVWTVPAAYSRLGLVYGYTIIWAKLNRAGEMIDFKVLKHEGHHSLEESSVGAIRSSFPFKPLPDHFPDQYLEITFLLRYPNLREMSSR